MLLCSKTSAIPNAYLKKSQKKLKLTSCKLYKHVCHWWFFFWHEEDSGCQDWAGFWLCSAVEKMKSFKGYVVPIYKYALSKHFSVGLLRISEELDVPFQNRTVSAFSKTGDPYRKNAMNTQNLLLRWKPPRDIKIINFFFLKKAQFSVS